MEGSPFQPKIGAGEGESPLASVRPENAPRPAASPASPLEARTFSSDLGSIRNTGGGEPAPYAPTPPQTVSNISAEPPKLAVAPAISSPAFPPLGEKKRGKKIFAALLTVLIVVALGAVGYFFVYPLFAGGDAAPEAVGNLPAATPALPETVETPSETLETPALETPPETDSFEGLRGLSSHVSLFRTAPDLTTEVILPELSLTGLRGALPAGSAATPVLREVVVKMPSGNVAPFSALAPLLAPSFFTAERLASFDDDATYFVYATAENAWFGLAAPLKSGAPIGPVQDAMSKLQGDPDLANFFLEFPGERGVWADSTIRGKPSSQVSFSAPGALFSYAWLGRNLIISTNADAADAAGARLGF